MSKKRTEKGEPLQAGLLRCMAAIDNQIARRMQRTPAEREAEGLRKWVPYNEKVEEISALLVGWLAEGKVEFDSLIVLSRALAKTLYIMVDELGEGDLGRVRSEACLSALEHMERDCKLGL